MVVVVDDALLLAVLAGSPPAELAEAVTTGELFTTGSWYYRLARAAADRTFSGALSNAMSALPPSERDLVAAGLDQLPRHVGLLSLRRLVPIMRHLGAGQRLNFLTAEAVAAALALDGAIRVTTESPLLRQACRTYGIDHQTTSI